MNGANQKSSEKKQMWEQIKSRRKDKCGSETKVVRKANVGGKQKWRGGGDCPKSQTFLSENRESDSGLV